MNEPDSTALDAIAAEAAEALINTRQISPFSSRPEGLTIDDAYRVTPRVRKIYQARGSKVVGRKIGFTNRTIWEQYGVYQPIWGYVFEETAGDLAQTETLALPPLLRAAHRTRNSVRPGLGTVGRYG